MPRVPRRSATILGDSVAEKEKKKKKRYPPQSGDTKVVDEEKECIRREDTTGIGTGTRGPCSELTTRLHMYGRAYESDKREPEGLAGARGAERGYRLRH